MRKTVYTLNIGDYAPEICSLTYPLLEHYADRIGANFHVIKGRYVPGWPLIYNKLQVGELARKHRDDWSIFIDSDCLVHPETIDFTEHLPPHTVAHNGADMAGVRWKYDDYFRRDGRNVGSCTWFIISPRSCTADLYRPLDDLTPDEAIANIRPTVEELTTVKTPASLIDDYTLSRNISRFGLKFLTLRDLLPAIGLSGASFLWHQYVITAEEKVKQMTEVLKNWKIDQWRLRRG